MSRDRRMTADEYRELLDGSSTPSLEDFARMEKYDNNAVWRLDTGHLANLLDAARERLEAVMKVCSDAEALGKDLSVADIQNAVRGEL